MPRKTIAVATAALAVALLAGCSSGGSGASDDDGAAAGSSASSASAAPESATPKAASQSKAEACSAFQSKVEDAAKDLQEQSSQLQADPAAALAKLDELDQSVSEGVSSVQNAEVKPKAEAFQAAYRDLLTQVKAISQDPASADMTAFGASTQGLEAASNDFRTVCPLS
ncbi:hypothetical protein [Curtobacterium sp. MCSS17_007]|uniref:hypothetical protein n=1 Tax=Curtobacterium sp. MCSS17_007 TaxID=2175646 RepID=UPI000DA79CA2|nr:hypothetical protein [Curtobacterium sp. MCSS17_007]WIE75263.1 hypothetical protein DEJ22_013580 [Curtobacterium sp. MCSS17_007]